MVHTLLRVPIIWFKKVWFKKLVKAPMLTMSKLCGSQFERCRYQIKLECWHVELAMIDSPNSPEIEPKEGSLGNHLWFLQNSSLVHNSCPSFVSKNMGLLVMPCNCYFAYKESMLIMKMALSMNENTNNKMLEMFFILAWSFRQRRNKWAHVYWICFVFIQTL